MIPDKCVACNAAYYVPDTIFRNIRQGMVHILFQTCEENCHRILLCINCKKLMELKCIIRKKHYSSIYVNEMIYYQENKQSLAQLLNGEELSSINITADCQYKYDKYLIWRPYDYDKNMIPIFNYLASVFIRELSKIIFQYISIPCRFYHSFDKNFWKHVFLLFTCSTCGLVYSE